MYALLLTGDTLLAVFLDLTGGLMEGSGDSKIAIWDIQQVGRDKSVSPIHKLDAKTFGPQHVVSINPSTALLATANTELVLIPRKPRLTIGTMASRCMILSNLSM